MNEAEVPPHRDAGSRHTPVEAPSTYAVLWDRDAAVEALNERRIDLGLALRELDNAARQAEGTAAKYLSPGRIKCLGLESFFRLSAALGLRVTLEIDHDATAAVLDERRPRQANQARPENFAQKCSQRTMQRALRHMALTLDWNEILKTVGKSRRAVVAEQRKPRNGT